MKFNHSFQINSLLKMITPPPPPPPHTHTHTHFSEVKIKNEHMIDKMEGRVKHAVNKYDDALIM